MRPPRNRACKLCVPSIKEERRRFGLQYLAERGEVVETSAVAEQVTARTAR